VRIGWATPFNIRSAVGKFSQIVCEELHARGHEVEVIRIESGAELDIDSIETELQVVGAAECDVAAYDAFVVNFGNHAPYHAQLVTLLAKRSPIGIFHDMEMRDFQWGLQHRHQLHLPLLVGIEPELAAKDLGDLVDPDARALLATLAALTCGAILHGPHYRATISAYCPGPVEVIPLCFPDMGTKRDTKPLKPGLRVTIFGVISDYKQPGRVIEALALLRPRFGHVELHLAGTAEDRVREVLVAQTKRLGLKPPLFHGYVSEESLQNIIEGSHAVCCLRYPVTEGGSASLVTALFRARPLIVSDIASYSMVPDELAYKVSYGDDPADLADALSDIFADQTAADARAAMAREWASDRFSAPAYVDAIEPMLGSNVRHALTKVARQLVPAVTTPGQEPIITAVNAFAEVLDWMEASQK